MFSTHKSETPTVHCHIYNRIGRMQLHNPGRGHALTPPMVGAMSEQLRKWNKEKSVNVILLEGAPSAPEKTQYFCAGRDVSFLYDQVKKTNIESASNVVTFLTQLYDLNTLISESEIPVVAITGGLTLGSGLALALSAPFRIATQNTVIALPQPMVGMFTDIGGSVHLTKAMNQNLPLASFLMLTGSYMGPHDSVVNRFNTHYMHTNEIPYLLRGLSKCDSKEQVQKMFDGFHVDHNMKPPQKVPYIHHQKVNKFFSPKNASVDAILVNLQTQTTDDWCQQTAAMMKLLSPACLQLSYALFKKRLGLNLADAKELDLKASKSLLGPLQEEFLIGAGRMLKLHQKQGWVASPQTVTKLLNDFVAEDRSFSPKM